MSDRSSKIRFLQVLKRTELCAQTAIRQLDLEDYRQLRQSLALILENNSEGEALLNILEASEQEAESASNRKSR